MRNSFGAIQRRVRRTLVLEPIQARMPSNALTVERRGYFVRLHAKQVYPIFIVALTFVFGALMRRP